MVAMGKMLRALGFERAETLADEPIGNYEANVMPPSRLDPLLTPDRALALPSVYRGVQVIAGMGSQLAIDVWRGGAKMDPTPSLAAQPDPWRSRGSWVERCLVGMALDGNAFLLKHRAPDLSVAALEVANPRQTFIVRDKDGRKWYDVVGLQGKVRRWSAVDVEHVWALEVPGHDRGLGPIQACRYALTGILDVREYADGWFGGTAQDVPSGILKSDQRLDPEAAKFYKTMWRDPDADLPADQKRRTGPTIRVLGQGLSYDPMRLNPSDAQWLESQAFGVLDVARMFGIPGDYLLAAVEGSSLTYSNLEMIDAQFLRTTLFPSYLRKLEAALTNVLPRGQEARFDASELLRPDAKTRAEIAQILIPLGVTTKEQVARVEGTTPGPATPAPAIPAKPGAKV